MGIMKRLAGSGRRSSNFASRGAFDVDMIVENREVVLMLDRLVYAKMVDRKDVRKAFRKVMAPVKKAVQNAVKATIPNDPRAAWKGVRVITLKKGAGAVAGLLDPSSPVRSSFLFRRPRGGKSGIIRNRKISDRTRQVEGYYGKDRAWLLRIINQGTVNGPRKAGIRGTLKKEANRGTLTAKKFFNAAEQPMKQAERNLGIELSRIIKEAAKG